MKEVYYKGQPYQYRIVEAGEKKQFNLYQGGVLKYSVEQAELDIRSIVTFILDSYYRSITKLPYKNGTVEIIPHQVNIQSIRSES